MKPEWERVLVDAGAELDDEAEQVAHYGAPERELQVATTGNVFADLSHRGLIAVHGEDAGSFLQGQLTNDVAAVDAGSCPLAGYCSPKGRLLALFRIFRRGDAYYLSLPRDQVEDVMARLQKFVLRARVTLEDASESFIRLGVAGPGSADELSGALDTELPAAGQTAECDGLTVLHLPEEPFRVELVGEMVEPMARLFDRLNVRCAPVGADAWELLTVTAGIPAIYSGTVDRFVPQMVNLDLLGGIAFDKGCYPGQEVIARTRNLGRLKRRMYRGHIEADERPAPGTPVYAGGDASGQASGEVVAARPHPDGGFELLAVLRLEAAQSESLQLGDTDRPAITLRELPYAVTTPEAGETE